MTDSDPPLVPRRGFAAVRALLRDLGTGLVRHFVWGELHEGGLELRGLDRNVRALAWFGLSMLVATIAALIFADSLRSACDLILLSSDPPRGQLAPTLLFPFTLFMLIVAWTFALCGSLHAHFAIRWATLVLFAVNAQGWNNAIVFGGRAAYHWHNYATLGAIVGVVLLFALRGSAKSRPAAEFATLFALVSVVFLVAQQHGLASMQQHGIPVQIAKMQFNIEYLGGLVTPLMILIGVDIAEFARRAADWTTDFVREHFPGYCVTGGLIGLLAWRWSIVGHELASDLARSSLVEQLGGYTGALVEVLAIIIVFASVMRSRLASSPWSETDLVEWCLRCSFPLVILYRFVLLIEFLLLSAMLACSEVGFSVTWGPVLWQAQRFLAESAQQPWLYGVCAVAACAAIVAQRRGQQPVALYLGLFSALTLWDLLTDRDGPLACLNWQGRTPGEFWWLVVLTSLAIDRWRRGSFTQAQQAHWCFMLLILALFRQRDFIENPFTPLLGFAGATFIAFGLVWDLATHGAWANRASRALPRESRLFLYLGYIILAGVVLNWAVATHDVDDVQKLTGGAALQGFDRFGKPLLYAIFLLKIRGGIDPREKQSTEATDSA